MSSVAPAPDSQVIGLVFTLAPAGPVRDAALAVLQGFPELNLGSIRGQYLPATAETTDPRTLHHALEAIVGVRALDVVFVEVNADGPDAAPRRGRHRRTDDGDFLEPAAS